VKKWTQYISKLAIISLLCTSILQLGWVDPASAAKPSNTTKHHKSELLVKYKNANNSTKIKSKVKTKLKLGKLNVKQQLNRSQIELLEIAENDNLDLVISELKKDPEVAYVQPNYVLNLATIPEDARFEEQWGLSNKGQFVFQNGTVGVDIGVAEAWDNTLGVPSTVVGVLDTGIDINHTDLQQNIYINPNEIPDNGIDDDGNGFIDDVNGWDFTNSDKTIFDNISDDTHGTHVAGIIAASANKAGVRGVAPGVRIIPLKVFVGNTGYTSDVIEAIDYAKQLGVKIINCSFGGANENLALKEAMQESGLLFIAAAGNSGQDLVKAPVYPASYNIPNVLSVAAVDNQGKRAAFSNYGTAVDVAAPGVGILSTIPEDDYSYQSGTSTAAPFVTGIAALLQSQYPDMTTIQIAERIRLTSAPLEALSREVASKGIVNAWRSITNTRGGTDTSSPRPVEKPNQPANNSGSDMLVTLAADVSPQLIEQIHYGEEGVNVATGNYAKSVTDMSVSAPGFTVNISRTYNSKDERPTSTMGRGWTFGFEGSLKDDTTNPTLFKVAKLPNGGAQVFVKGANDTYTANDSHSTLVKQGDGSHILTTKDQYTYGFSAAGWLTWMKDRNGNQLLIEVDASGKVKKITDTVGRNYIVAYNTAGYLTTMTDPIGRTVKYEYDASNRLVKVTDPMNNVSAQYEYDGQGYLTKIKDSAQNILDTIIYDHAAGADQHKVTRYTNVFGNADTYTYDNTNRKTTMKDASGRTIMKWYDTAMFVIKSQDPEGRIATVDYYLDANGFNKFGEEKAITDRYGNKTQYVRDNNGNITKITNPDNSFREFVYDDKNNLILEKDELGKVTNYIYDASKINLLQTVQPLNGTDAYSESSDPAKFAIKSYIYYTAAEAAKLGYKAKGLVKSETDPEGGMTVYTYDTDGNKKTKTDPNNNVTKYEYNGIGWLTATLSPMGYRTDFTYDRNGRLVRTVQDEGETSLQEYDVFGRNVQQITPNQYNPVDDGLNDAAPAYVYRNNSVGLRYDYYPSGKVKTETDALGNTVTYTYDLYGNTLTVTRPNQSVYVYEYDVMNRLKKVSFKKDSNAVPELQKEYAYTMNSNGTTQKTETVYLNATETAVTVWIYDSLGREIEKQDADNTRMLTAYFANSTVKSVTDSRSHTTYFKYDGLNRQTGSWQPIENGKYLYSGTVYDRAGNKLSVTSGKDKVTLYGVPVTDRTLSTSYTYDAAGLLTSTLDSAGGKSLYQYDNDGRLVRQDDYANETDVVTTEYTSNWAGKTVSERVHVESRDLTGNDRNDTRDTLLETTFEYDKNGNLVAETTPDGVRTAYTYDALNRQTGTNKQGTDENRLPVIITTATTYNWAGSVLTSTDALGNVTTNEYNELGLLVKQIDALGGITLYDYDRAGRKIVQVSPQNVDLTKSIADLNRTEYTYDVMGRIKLVTEKFKEKKVDPVSFAWVEQWTEAVTKAYRYDENGNVVKELSGEGYKTGVGATADTRIDSGYGIETRYNAANLAINMLDPVSKERGLKFTKAYGYDGVGRKISETDADGVVNGTYYDDAGRVVKQTVRKSANAPEQVLVTSRYDGLGQLVSSTDGNGNKTEYVYNALGSVRQTTAPGDATMPEYVVFNQYDAMGRLSRQQDSLGVVDLFSYDSEGRQVSHTGQKQDNSEAITIMTSYDKNGNKRFATDGNGNTQEYIYDKMSRLIENKVKVTDVKGNANVQSTKLSYDKNGNKLTSTDWLGNTTTYVYDGKNRLIETIDPKGISTEKLEYDANDAQVKSYDALSHVTKFIFDQNNRQLVTIDPEGYRSLQTYDNVGLVDTQTDGKGNTTQYTYDTLGRLLSVTNALGEVTSYTYDLNGNRLTQTDGRGNVATFEYNSGNKLIRRIDAGGRTGAPGRYVYIDAKMETYTYTASGQMATKVDRNGNTTTYVHDSHNRLLSQTVTGLSVTELLAERQISYTYDNNGNQLSMTDSSGTTRRTYDEMNRVISKSVPKLGTSTFLLDVITDQPAGMRAEVTTDVKGHVTTRSYDQVGRLVQVKADNDQPTVYAYFDDGSRQSVTYPNGTREEYTYFKNKQLQTLNNYQGATILDNYSYVYDAAGNQTSKTEVVQGVNKGTTTYTYDALNRLKIVTEPGGKLTEYSFDPSGNRIAEKVTEGSAMTMTAYAYNEQNRLLSTTEVKPAETQVVKYTYDNNGNMTLKATEITKKVDPLNPVAPSFGAFIYGQENSNPAIANILSGTAKYTYDVWNQLIRVTSGSSDMEYQYNGDGLRVKKTSSNGQSTLYVYEYDQVVLETDGSGKETARNIYGLNLLTRTVGTDKYYYLYNGHADVTALVDAAGQVKGTYYYDAFGNIMQNTGELNNPIRYAGYQYDEESKLYYLNARYYDPKIARFLTEDTVRGTGNDPLSLNLYTYSHNEPVMYIDPSGHANANLRDLANTAGGSVAWDAKKGVATVKVNGVTRTFDKDDYKMINGRIVIDTGKFDSIFYNDKTKTQIHSEVRGSTVMVSKVDPKKKETQVGPSTYTGPSYFSSSTKNTNDVGKSSNKVVLPDFLDPVVAQLGKEKAAKIYNTLITKTEINKEDAKALGLNSTDASLIEVSYSAYLMGISLTEAQMIYRDSQSEGNATGPKIVTTKGTGQTSLAGKMAGGAKKLQEVKPNSTTFNVNQAPKVTTKASSLKVSNESLDHANTGDFTRNPRTGEISKMSGGGHGQDNIDFLEKNGIEYNIEKTFSNGVRIGNVPDHKSKGKRTGTGQAWFPDNWTKEEIGRAGEHVANMPANKGIADGVTIFGEYKGVRVGVIKTNGQIGTIFPDNMLQP